jgi:hypothetical protein
VARLLSGNPGNFVAQPKRFRGVPSRIESACDALKFSHELKNTRIAALFRRHPALLCVFFSTQTRNERTFLPFASADHGAAAYKT